jgi:DNA (cytosine-5)-methyltransferase 1
MDKGVTEYPKWKVNFIRQNREFYADNEVMLKEFSKKLLSLPLSFQKFEWNCQGGERDLFKHIVQFRASGIRVKKDDTSPALISSTSSQIPIVASEKRYVSKHEASKLQ